MLTGPFIMTKQQKDRESRDGSKTYPGKYVVTVLSGDRTVQVEYANERAFTAMTGYVPSELAPQERIALPVGVRSAQGYTFFFGRNV